MKVTRSNQLNHPVTAKIPQKLWMICFYNGIDIDKIPDPDTPFDQLDSLRLPEYPLQFFSLLLLLYPDISAAKLLDFNGIQDEMSPTDIVLISTAFGRLDILKTYEKKISDTKLKSILSTSNCYSFLLAAENSHYATLRWILEKLPRHQREMVYAEHSYVFCQAAANGCLKTLRWLCKVFPNGALSMAQSRDWMAFSVAAKNGHLNVLRWFTDTFSDYLQDMIRSNYWYPFTLAARNGQLEVLQWLAKFSPDNLVRMMQHNHYYAFRMASQKGHLKIIQWMVLQNPDEFSNMISYDHWHAFRLAAQNGHLELLQWFAEKKPNDLPNMIKALGYDALKKAGLNGHIETVLWLNAKAPEGTPQILESCNRLFFSYVAANGHLKVLQWFAQNLPNAVRPMIHSHQWHASKSAAKNGHLPVLKWLASRILDADRTAMIRVDRWLTFKLAAENGHPPILQWLAEQVPEDLFEMIQDKNWYAFRLAAKNGHLKTLRWLVKQAPLHLQSMIEAEQFWAFRHAAHNLHFSSCNWLLENPQCLAFADSRPDQYMKKIIHPWSIKFLNRLYEKYELHYDKKNFNVRPDQARLCLYVLRHLIRLNKPAPKKHIPFLLRIPGVQSIAHTDLNGAGPNTLLKNALILCRRDTAKQLLSIETVRKLAERDHFYADRTYRDVDLKELAKNTESSMVALTGETVKDLVKLEKKYFPDATEDLELHMKALRAWLILRYNANPASIYINNTPTCLPLEYDTFQKMQLNTTQRQAALQAYYQDTNHTALRLLLNPNPWMNPAANFVVRLSDKAKSARSNFERYKRLILTLWKAATDTNKLPTDDHTIEGREEHFVDELALMNRAHNYDTPEDASKGDNPSCSPGMYRRLSQSLIGYPGLSLLSVPMLRDEIKEFARFHFETAISCGNPIEIKEKINRYITELSLDKNSADTLLRLNIPEGKTADFELYLSNKYGPKYSDNLSLVYFVQSQLKVNRKSPDPMDYIHVLKFYTLINLDQLLNQGTENTHVTRNPAAENRIGYFFNTNTQNPNTTKEEKNPSPG